MFLYITFLAVSLKFELYLTLFEFVKLMLSVCDTHEQNMCGLTFLFW